MKSKSDNIPSSDIPVDGKLIIRVVDYLSKHEPYDTAFWKELEFAEVAIGDISIYKRDLLDELNQPGSPVYKPGGLNEDELRKIAFSLRQFIRRLRSMPKLERFADWQFIEPIFPPSNRIYEAGTPVTSYIEPDNDQINSIIDYIDTHYPEAVKLWRVIYQHNKLLLDKDYFNEGASGYYFHNRLNEAFDHFILLQPYQVFSSESLERVSRMIGESDLFHSEGVK